MVLVYNLYMSLCICLCVTMMEEGYDCFFYNRKVLTLDIWANSVIFHLPLHRLCEACVAMKHH